MVARLKYLIVQAVTGLWRSASVTLMSVGIIGFALSLLALFWIATTNLQDLADQVSHQAGISVYLDSANSAAQNQSLERELRLWPEITHTELVTSTAAMDWLRTNLATEASVLDGLPPDLLPSSIELRIDELDLTGVRKMVKKIGEIKGVSDVRYGQEDIKRIQGVLGLVRTSMQFLSLFLGVALFLIVSNAIRLAIYSRKDEIEVMSLIGGTRFFIGLPFVLEGALVGFLGGALSLVLLLGFEGVLIAWLHWGLNQTYGVQSVDFLNIRMLLNLLCLGTVLGLLSSTYATIRFVRL